MQCTETITVGVHQAQLDVTSQFKFDPLVSAKARDVVEGTFADLSDAVPGIERIKLTETRTLEREDDGTHRATYRCDLELNFDEAHKQAFDACFGA